MMTLDWTPFTLYDAFRTMPFVTSQTSFFVYGLQAFLYPVPLGLMILMILIFQLGAFFISSF